MIFYSAFENRHGASATKTLQIKNHMVLLKKIDGWEWIKSKECAYKETQVRHGSW